MDRPTPLSLLQLPPEVLLHALSLASPQDCAHFASTSRSTNSLCSTDLLWKNLHSSLLDPLPQSSPTSTDQPHRQLIKRFVEATTLLEKTQSSDFTPPPDKLLPLLETLVHLAVNRPIAGIDSLNQSFLEKYLSPNTSNILTLHPSLSRQPRLRSRSKPSSSNVRISELVSQLHTLSTPSLLAVSSSSARTTAREIVYERLNFAKSSSYGPLESNGSGLVDWRKVEAISLLMMANMEDAKSMGWGTEAGEADPAIPPSGWDSTRSHSARPKPEVKVDPRDWAGVTTHEWLGTYSFLHYPVYHHFNNHRTERFIPSLAEENEAVGDCMSLKLELVPEGEELMPPMVAFGERGTEREGGNQGRMSVDSDDDEDDEDFDQDQLDDLVTDSDDSNSSEEEEDGFDTHFVTNNSISQDQDESPPTSPHLDDTSSSPSPPIGPLPPSSSSSTSQPSTSSPTSNYPKLSFRGSSLPLQLRTLSFTGTFLNSQSQAHFNPRDRSIRGTVEMNDGGEVIWKYIIRYGGRDQWAMTGVQVGGVKSAFGVVGSWTCADREAADEEGPNGPFWYWPHIPA